MGDSDQAPSGRSSIERFIGVSLGGGRGKTTAVARMERSEDGEADLVLTEARVKGEHRGGGAAQTVRGAFRDGPLIEYLTQWVDDQTVVAVDAPLTLPACVRCDLPCPGVDACVVPAVVWMRTHAGPLAIHRGRRDPGKPNVTPYTQRATELVLEHVTLQPREALGQGMGPLAARAAYLRRALSPGLRLNENLIEVHPRATLIRLYGSEEERKTRRGETEAAWDQRKQMLVRLSEGLVFDRVWPELVVRNVHVFHAVVSAFTAVLWAREGWRGPENLRPRREPPVDDEPVGGEADSASPTPVAADAAARPSALEQALDELGDLWLVDGWIWAPPRRPRRKLRE